MCAAGLSTCHFAWAFHSEAEEELLNMIPAMQRGDAQWSDLRAVGVGWWIRNINTLRKMVDKVPVLLMRAASSSSSSFLSFVFDAEFIYLSSLFTAGKNPSFLLWGFGPF